MSSPREIDLLRGGVLRRPPERETANYVSSREHDRRIAKYVLEINEAHVINLAKNGILERAEASVLLRSLERIQPNVEFPPEMEDIHMYIETRVVTDLGEQTGGKLNTGKSRNDQVATALRMASRGVVQNILDEVMHLRFVLLNLAAKYKSALMPGYTHMQHSQPTTLGHLLMAHHDQLARDTGRFIDALDRINLCPMGSAAMTTTNFPLDRALFVKLLGFDGILVNSIDAVSARDFLLEVLSAIAIMNTHLSSIAQEVVLWSTTEYGFIKLPDEFTSTSSIMPQKRNPTVAEVARARTGYAIGDLTSCLTIIKALPLSYNLDLQEVTPLFWHSYDEVLATLRVTAKMLEESKFDRRRMEESLSRGYSVATQMANDLVLRHGVSFRSAHRAVGRLVSYAMGQHKPLQEIEPEKVKEILSGSIGRPRIAFDEDMSATLDPRKAVESHDLMGGPSGRSMDLALRIGRTNYRRHELMIRKARMRSSSAQKLLKLEASKLKAR